MISVDEAYAHCANVARRHYENFPVASVLVLNSAEGTLAEDQIEAAVAAVLARLASDVNARLRA